MSLSLLVLGVIVTLAGTGMVAYGIPINEFGLGNTLIVAGTTAFVGGLILIALSVAVKQLRRIAESLMSRPGNLPRTNELFEPATIGRQASGRIPFPPKPEPRVRAPVPAPSEPHLDAAPSIDTTGEQFDRPPAFARSVVPEPRIVPERDETPLSPQQPRFATARDRQDDDLSESLLATAFSRLDVSLRPAPPAAETAKQNEFDSVWPAEPRKTSETPAEEPEEPSENDQQAEPYAVSILKSGVVDGMAYTLYSDGSIEAEMPQGTMRFASIAELRTYLEKSS